MHETRTGMWQKFPYRDYSAETKKRTDDPELCVYDPKKKVGRKKFLDKAANGAGTK